MHTNSITPAPKAQPTTLDDTYLASIGFMYADFAPESHLMLLAYCQRNGYDPINREAYLYRDDEGHEIVLDATRAAQATLWQWLEKQGAHLTWGQPVIVTNPAEAKQNGLSDGDLMVKITLYDDVDQATHCQRTAIYAAAGWTPAQIIAQMGDIPAKTQTIGRGLYRVDEGDSWKRVRNWSPVKAAITRAKRDATMSRLLSARIIHDHTRDLPMPAPEALEAAYGPTLDDALIADLFAKAAIQNTANHAQQPVVKLATAKSWRASDDDSLI